MPFLSVASSGPTLAATPAYLSSRRLRLIVLVVFGVVTTVVAVVAAQVIDHPPVALIVVAGPAVVAVGAVLVAGPRVCLAALILTDVLGLYKNTLDVGGLGVRILDLFWVALVVWTLVIRHRGERPVVARIGQAQLAVLLAAFAVSLYPVAVLGWGDVADPFVAWIRLAQTFSLVWLVPYALPRRRDLLFVLRCVEFGLTIEVVRALGDAALSGSLGERLQGGLGPNTEGLVGALLIVAAVHSPVPHRRGLRAGMLVLGALGLAASRSLGATAAVAAVLGIFGFRRYGAPRSANRSYVLPLRLLLVLLAALAVASTLRPENLPSSSTFSTSSTAQRAVLARAGFDMFANHPATGVGWGRAVSVIGEESAARTGVFAGVNAHVLPGATGASVHNAYIEVLAEAGLLGFLCLLVLVVVAIRRVRGALPALRPDPEGYALAMSLVALLVTILVWWNDNAVFGAQPESVLAAVFFGMLAVTLAPPPVPAPPLTISGAAAGDG